jgi:hypothetical protein
MGQSRCQCDCVSLGPRPARRHLGATAHGGVTRSHAVTHGDSHRLTPSHGAYEAMTVSYRVRQTQVLNLFNLILLFNLSPAKEE